VVVGRRRGLTVLDDEEHTAPPGRSGRSAEDRRAGERNGALEELRRDQVPPALGHVGKPRGQVDVDHLDSIGDPVGPGLGRQPAKGRERDVDGGHGPPPSGQPHGVTPLTATCRPVIQVCRIYLGRCIDGWSGARSHRHGPVTADLDVDVVVAGAGAAGLAAALRSAEMGASVALLEVATHFRESNNTSMSTSMIPAGGSRWQLDLGIDDSPARFGADIVKKTEGSADPLLTAALTGVAPELVAWLADSCGVPLSLVTDFVYPGHSVARCHSVPDRSGATLLRHLLARAETGEQTALMVPARLERVEPDPDGNAFTSTVRRGGATEVLRSRSVVLASGGYGADPVYKDRYIPEMAMAMYHGGDGCRGDALRIGEELGADVGYLDAYQGHGSVAMPHAIIVTWAAQVHGAIILNTDGHRFAAETQGYSEFARLVQDQPGQVAWVVLDRRIHELCQPFADYQHLMAAGALRWADDPAALAAVMSASPDTVADELRQLERVAAGELPDPLGRDPVSPGLRAPYAAIRIAGALFHTQGGLLVDGAATVRRDGRAIPGLFAAGGAAAGISGHGPAGYLAGNGLLAALGLGYLAGSGVGRRRAELG
jgi:fumarate reductase flavoprotein subunit